MLHRRQWLRRTSAAAVGSFAPFLTLAQPGKSAQSTGPLAIVQIADMSAAQQDVSRDFLTGSRAAWQEINARGGLNGRKIQHTVIETDGSAAALSSALTTAKDNPACVALAGTVSDPLAQSVAQALALDATPLAHIAPWLQTDGFEADNRTLCVFASRTEQIEHALKSLSVMGMTEVGAVYAGTTEYSLYRADIERSCKTLKLRAKHFQNGSELTALGRTMAPSTPAVLLFLGGTPELVQFTQGLETQSRQRYIVAMADVNLQTLLQMGAARKTPVIATQVVPVTSASLAVVRAYRQSLLKYFDEAPTAISLAGYISARVGYEILSSVDGSITRASVRAAAMQMSNLDVGGYRVAYANHRRTSAYVTQSMLTADGRVLG